MPNLPVTFDDVVAARGRIAGHVHRTPVLTSRQIDETVGCRVFLKCETFQRVGAFKARGAFSRLTLMTPEERSRGVVAFSSGNHAQAVALAARELGVRATIVMPLDAPASKVAATRGYGAQVVLYDRAGGEDREAIARKYVEEEGATLVPPFDDEAIIAGQGTLGLELMEDVPDLEVIVTPCGGGGLLSGVSLAARGFNPGIRLYGVEPEAGDDMQRSLAAGHPVTIPLPTTIADALQTTRPADRTFAIVSTLAEGVVTVSDLELRRAMALLASRMKIVVEPGGTAAFAALLHRKIPDVAGRKVGVVLSGGNVDLERFGKLVEGVEI
ncbi:MAG TPA: pyridoxal-phosphate dependent enzyme [Thermoanaerobaculia bacterium]|jgi:threonine dehydratase|nr:pyridoxal-phosphate dependent enzyme [Thermoanaerobaculia bacterium]